ncbi:MAG TPA: c-type cytochrome domain-containing protein [Agriterribacter sp.]|nr:c-type cytochrome domain-containing protein [Agriterribacter sp.]
MQTDWSLFFGSFHPLIVHIPIGIILFAALLYVIAAYRSSRILDIAINIALFVGAISAAFAALSGYFLSANGGYAPDTLFWHKWIGIAAAILTFCVWLIRKNKKYDVVLLKGRISAWLLSLCILFITVGGHLGGTMTHGEGYMTAHMPSFLRSFFSEPNKVQLKKLPQQPDSVVIFADIIQPIFTSKCINCHNSDKQKGELNLSSVEAIMKGGKSGNTIVPGDVEKSELMHRITLDPGSSKFMPAEKQPPLTAVETGLLKWWIASGADFTKKIGEANLDEKTKYLLSFYLGYDEENNTEIILPEAPPADSIIVQELKGMKLVVRSLTAQSNLLDVSFVMVQKASLEQKKMLLQKLLKLKDQLYYLDLSNCSLTNDNLALVAGLTNLNKLAVQKNNLTDDAVAPLKALQQLVNLNIGQNPITDKSISIFDQMDGLQKINLWQTSITDEGVKKLQAAKIGLVVER